MEKPFTLKSGWTELFVGLFSGILAFLLAGNAFFIKRLVDKLDNTESSMLAIRSEVVLMRYQIQTILEQKQKASYQTKKEEPWIKTLKTF